MTHPVMSEKPSLNDDPLGQTDGFFLWTLWQAEARPNLKGQPLLQRGIRRKGGIVGEAAAPIFDF